MARALKNILRFTYSASLTFFLLCSWMNHGSSVTFMFAWYWLRGGRDDQGTRSLPEEMLSLVSVSKASITDSIVGDMHLKLEGWLLVE